MSNRKLSETTKNLIAAKELINTPDKWCQRAYGKRKGEPVALLQLADTFCMKGAVYKVHGAKTTGDYHSLDMLLTYREFRFLETAINIKTDGYGNPTIHGFNDRPKTTHRDVLEVFDKAIALSVMEDQK